jgi:hypothetical protein
MLSSDFLKNVKSHELPSEIEFLSAIAYTKSLYPEDKELQSLSETELIKELTTFKNSSEVISLDEIKFDLTASSLKATPCTDAISILIFDAIRIVIKTAGYSISKDGEIAKAFIAQLSDKIDFNAPIWHKIAQDFSNAKSPLDIANCIVLLCRTCFQLGIITLFVKVLKGKMTKIEWVKFTISVSIQIGKFIVTEGEEFVLKVLSMLDELDTLMEDAKNILNSCVFTIK